MNFQERKLRLLTILIAAIAFSFAWLIPVNVYAAGSNGGGKSAKTGDGGTAVYQGKADSVCNTSSTGSDCKIAGVNCKANANCNKIYSYLIKAADTLSALVGIVAVAMIIFGGIEFSSSGGDPQKVASAKNHITNAVIALVAFLFLWAFLNFIIPGGLFNG